MSAAPPETPTLPTLTELPTGLRLFSDGKSVVHRQRGDGVFLDIEFPERVWRESNYSLRYHVFTSETENVSVPAISAIDAIVKSGIERPFKIVRGMAAEETVAAVVQAGRLVPPDQVETTPDAADASGGDAGADPADAGVEPGPDPDAHAGAEQTDPQVETDTATEPAGTVGDVSDAADQPAGAEQAEAEQETP